MCKKEKMLVVSAHPGDVLWRCSGAIAKHVVAGGEARVISLTDGLSGEADELMSQKKMSLVEARDIRKRQLQKAAEVLGISKVELWSLQDYPFEITRESLHLLARLLRDYRPDLILTHHREDPLNPDHGTIPRFVMMAVEIACGRGVRLDGEKVLERRPAIFCFEPHASEYSNFEPNVYIDITEVWDIKLAAMGCIDKKTLHECYTDRAKLRATNASSFGLKGCYYAEAYQAVYPFARTGNFVY